MPYSDRDLSALQLGPYLEAWLATRALELRPSTLDTYRRLVRIHILPHLGALTLQDLTPQRLQAWLAVLAQTKARGGGRLSPRTISFVMAVLRAALSDAVRLGTLEQSPFRRVRGPRPAPRVVAAFSLAQVRHLDQVAADHRLGPLFSFLWQTGLRIGEALALRWPCAGPIWTSRGVACRCGAAWRRWAVTSWRERRRRLPGCVRSRSPTRHWTSCAASANGYWRKGLTRRAWSSRAAGAPCSRDAT